ncbi:hypothetical protein BU26DRAFT_349655 [Trematosphaeria pertusa]|uniref:Uncharacterized protein n=1 Tax=Trematosphaeria pertusa TaxID=390896 RepID=A0A6A6IDC4_9PLEO|nr:uncharacterized protein BU26DRAFT_349655 [Trematosphaeria pertusa]KAF2247560.1 hypothetical protein BU26DRAFT_349655 [Trematosphaeria pertusa]
MRAARGAVSLQCSGEILAGGRRNGCAGVWQRYRAEFCAVLGRARPAITAHSGLALPPLQHQHHPGNPPPPHTRSVATLLSSRCKGGIVPSLSRRQCTLLTSMSPPAVRFQKVTRLRDP